MRLESLHLKNFRTYESLDVQLESRLTFLTGRNASGKTNVIEALGLLSLGKSFRGAADRDMAREGSNGYFISGSYLRGGQKYTLDLGCETTGGSIRRKIKLNGKQLQGRSELIGNFITVIFSPSDIMIVEGGPAMRRRFLDALLSSQNREYLQNLIHYGRILRQRNAILKNIRQNRARLQDLKPWNSGLASYGRKILTARLDFIRDFQGIFQDSLLRISGSRDRLELSLQLSSEAEKENYEGALESNAMRDVGAGFTILGPHRHNLLFLNDGMDILQRGSQGQKRSVVLALRMAEFYYLKGKLGFSPILLIDDVIRELDAFRRGAFVRLLHESGQAVFTTPDLDGMDRFLEDLKDEMTVLQIREPGHIESVTGMETGGIA